MAHLPSKGKALPIGATQLNLKISTLCRRFQTKEEDILCNSNYINLTKWKLIHSDRKQNSGCLDRGREEG